MNLNKIPSKSICLLNNEDESWVWHGRIIYIHMYHLNKLVHKNLVIRLPNLWFEKSRLCDSWQMGKQGSLLKLKMVFLQIGPYNFCTWIFLSHQEPKVFAEIYLFLLWMSTLAIHAYYLYLDKRCVSCLTETWKNYP